MDRLMHDIFRGWRVASMMSDVELLGSGRIVDVDVAVRVAGKSDAGMPTGNPFLVWAPLTLLSEDRKRVHPEKNIVLWQTVNNEKQPCMRSLSAFLKAVTAVDVAETSAKPEEKSSVLEFTFIACALRMLWGYRVDLAREVAPACRQFAKLAGIESCDDIWGSGAWKTLPVAPPRGIRTIACDGHKIGGLIREWHDEVFRKFRMAEAQPIVADAKDMVPYQSVIDQGAVTVERHEKKRDSLSANGNSDWRGLSKEELERLVWSYPRQQLASFLNVTDMAIRKKCKKLMIPQPPRGFWQKVKSGTAGEVTVFLSAHGLEIPKWWRLAECRRGLEEIESADNVKELLVQQ